MSNLFITGATGNIGSEVIRYLMTSAHGHTVFAGVRDIAKAQKQFAEYDKLRYVHFDFEEPDTFAAALQQMDRIFLLRPPHISDVERYFHPLISKIKELQVPEVVFLSVQGTEKSSIIPHHKIEKLIQTFGLDYIFLRPGYFMQNLTTTLLGDIQSKRQIILPAGKAKFNWIDIENIGEAGALLLDRFDAHKNTAPEITGYENEDFAQVVAQINAAIDRPIQYRSVNPIRFFAIKQKEGMATGLILVMILLHFLPRFQPAPAISDFYEKLTGKKPTTLRTFIEREKAKFR